LYKNAISMARPPFKPTAAQKRTVAIAAGGGMTHEEIALGLGISRVTLDKYFGLELSAGASQKRLEVLNAMFAAAKKGNVSAQRAYIAFDPKPAAPPLPAEPKAPAKGKKEQAQDDAVTAAKGTGWDELLAPRAPLQ
jgi:hypothetical protein